jgi:phospholipid-binding lipoprotein MlaA
MPSLRVDLDQNRQCTPLKNRDQEKAGYCAAGIQVEGANPVDRRRMDLDRSKLTRRKMTGRHFRAAGLLVQTALVLAACASANVSSPDDPWEAYNRSAFGTFLFLDRNAFRPAAETYREIVPDPVRVSLQNVMQNLDAPGIFANDVLRGRVQPAETMFMRATINTTLGIGGLFDVAKTMGFEPHLDDFGKTLAEYGVGSGPYLFVILFGPTDVRDLTGSMVDLLLNPLLAIDWAGRFFAISGDVGFKALDRRERNLENWDQVRRSSADFYATIRDAYIQSRNHEIREELGQTEELPEF